ncbi:MAG: hypothetical protein HY650_08065 [Acidobacteria bacterium]|nr:hypothetical protein [Acidobacteriota bacterium]
MSAAPHFAALFTVLFLSTGAAASLGSTAPELHPWEVQDSNPSGARKSEAGKWPTKIDGYQVYRPDKDEAGVIEFYDLIDITGVTPRQLTTDSLTVGLRIVLHPVEISGEIEVLRFEDMKLNGVPFQIAEVRSTFPLPAKEPKPLPEDLALTVRFSEVGPALLRNLLEPDKDLMIEGNALIFGRFRKFGIPFKRVVPVELKTRRPSPLAGMPGLGLLIDRLSGPEP